MQYFFIPVLMDMAQSLINRFTCFIDPSHHGYLVSTKKVYTEKDKNAGQCRRINMKIISCWKGKCLQKKYYKCIKYAKRCRVSYDRECNVCNRYYYQKCYRRMYYGRYVTKCVNGPSMPRECTRKVVQRVPEDRITKCKSFHTNCFIFQQFCLTKETLFREFDNNDNG